MFNGLMLVNGHVTYTGKHKILINFFWIYLFI